MTERVWVEVGISQAVLPRAAMAVMSFGLARYGYELWGLSASTAGLFSGAWFSCLAVVWLVVGESGGVSDD